MKITNKTLVLDVSYLARGIINAERAFIIALNGNAEIIHEHDEHFKLVNKDLIINKPSVIRIKKYVNDRLHKVNLTRENVFRRDGYRCLYCGEDRKKLLTVDHVIPKSKGGKDSWNNLVTACKKCNNEKSDLPVEEFGKLLKQPYTPHYLMMLKSMFDIPEEWKKYLLFQ